MMDQEFNLAYYAHSMEIYNSDREAFEYDFISENFNGFVICPNNHLGEKGDIKPYLDIVKKTQTLFVSEYQGYVGLGVYQEIQIAIKNKIPIYVIYHVPMDVVLKPFQNMKITNHFSLTKYGVINSSLT